MSDICTVVVSLEPLDDWYPICGKPARYENVLGPMCEEHMELFAATGSPSGGNPSGVPL